ncbi:reverse transcriptase domain-containing protein [Tanacetum coccineum]
MEYLPKRRWSTLENKRANIMIKAIDKELKERRMMRSLEKFVAFKTKRQQQYEHVGPEVARSQEGKRSQDDDKRLCLVDDLKEVLNHMHINSNVVAGGIFLYKTPNQAYQLLEDKVLLKLDWAKNKKTKSSLKKTVAFAAEGKKIEAQYGKFLDMIRAVRINVPLVDVLARMSNYGKFLKELVNNKHKIEQISAAFLSDESSAILQNKVAPKLGDPRSFLIPFNFNKALSCNALADLCASINLMSYSLYAKLSLETLKPTKMSVRLADRSFQYPVGIPENMLVEVGKFTFPADFVILEMEEGKEDFDALLDEGSEILHSIEGTILEEKLFAEFDEFMAMTANENSEFESDTKEPHFEKITFNTNYKIKTSLEEPPMDLELKPLPDNLKYVFLEEPSFLPVIISSQLSEENKNKLIPIDPMDQEKTTFTCPFGTYAYRRMPFGLCNASATFQRCMLAIFHDMIEESVEVFMDDFSVFGSSFDHCLNNLDKMLQRYEDAHLVLN